MDDPADWSTARVVQELCTIDGSRRLRDGGIRLPADLEDRLRYHEIDGKQLVHETKDNRRQELFFEAIGIDKFAHKTFFLGAIEKLRHESQQLSGDSQSAKRRHNSASEEAGDTSATPEKRRRTQPQPVVTEGGADEQSPQLDSGLGTEWKLDPAKQTNKPEDTATPPRHKTKVRRSIEEDHAAATQGLYSDSDRETAVTRIAAPKDDLNRNANPVGRGSADMSPSHATETEVVDLISNDDEDPAVDEDGDEDDQESFQQQIEDIGGRFANRSISDEDWKSVCRMFQCHEDIQEHKPVGFKLPISGYQLHAIWWQLTQYPVRGVPGGCLGDEMGLGKTIEVLAVFILFTMIKMNYIESGSAKSDRCPSQYLSPYGLLCPCVKTGETYQIATELPSLPILCFVPPTSIHGWRREFENLVDSNHLIMKKLRFSIMHKDLRGDDTYFHNKDRVRRTTAKAIEVNENGQPNCYLTGQDGLSNWFLLVSSSGAKELRKAYNGKRVRSRNEDGPRGGEEFTINGLAASFVFFDEAHTYRGSLISPTLPFDLLKTITEKSWEPTVAFAVPGSLTAGGPSQLTNIVDHILRVKAEREDEPSIGGITDANKLEEMKNDWNYLLQKNHLTSNPKTKAEVDKRKKSLGGLMKSLVPPILIARRNVDTFRGQVIGDDGREIQIEQIKCNMLDRSGRDAFCKLTANVQTYVSQAFDEKHNTWMTRGRKCPEPTKSSVELEFFGGQSDSRIAMSLGEGHGCVWTQLLRANIYPEIARLYSEELVTEDDLAHDSVNSHGDKACQLVATDAGRVALRQQLATSPFWPYRLPLMK
ncbi:hypothetical protein F4814DRAFT_460735 [Daldinia grandis]|nr:hypothetical protein F4814DRAFT_460735 [Daldinia grandis]